MSIQTMKRKALHTQANATRKSARGPGGVWLPQGPFGSPRDLRTVMLEQALRGPGPVGFSLQGGTRSISVGQDMKMSQSGTAFRGEYARGWGGRQGRYARPEPLMNAPPVHALLQGTQQRFIKPSVLDQRTMLRRRRPWIENGQYPYYWVQPMYTGNQVQTASQGVYLSNLRAAADRHLRVNDQAAYAGYLRHHGPFGCRRTPASGHTMAMMQSSAPYTKALHQPVSASEYTAHRQRRCARPVGPAKPFPFAVAAGPGVLTGGATTVIGVAASLTGPTYLTPPAWYVAAPASCT